MNARGLHRYVDDLLDGRRPRLFDADRFEAEQLRIAIELRAARTGKRDSDVIEEALRSQLGLDLARGQTPVRKETEGSRAAVAGARLAERLNVRARLLAAVAAVASFGQAQ